MNNLDNFNIGHPSFFQNPLKDKEILANLDKAKFTNPLEMWQNKVSFDTDKSNDNTESLSGYTIKYDIKDPPLSKQELDKLKDSLDPVIFETLNNCEPNLLFYTFFSKENIANLQKTIRFTVNKWSGYHIGDQSIVELVLVMEHIFSTRARLIDENRAPSKVLFKHNYNEIYRLNELVVNEAVPIIVDKVNQHMQYVEKVENPLSSKSLARPEDTRITGTKLYRASTDLLALY